jgi:hypothetical protein
MSIMRSVWNFVSSPIREAAPARPCPVDAIVRLLRTAPEPPNSPSVLPSRIRAATGGRGWLQARQRRS